MVLILTIKHMMRKFFKATGITIGVLILLVFLFPLFFKGTIVRAVKRYAQNAVMAKVDFNESVSLSLIKNFPNLSISISDVHISGIDSFAGDTLLQAGNISLTINLKSLFGSGPMEVSKVGLDEASLRLKVLASGKANWDIVKPDTAAVKTDTTAALFRLTLKEFNISRAALLYDDRSLGFNMQLQDLNHRLSGDFTASQFLLSTTTKAQQFTMEYGGISWVKKAKLELDADLDMDMNAMRFAFRKGTLLLNELQLAAEGFVAMNDADMDMDVRVQALRQDFKSFLSVIPGFYQNAFAQIRAAGSLAFTAMVKGKYSETQMPAFQTKLNIGDGSFSYPNMPFKAEQIKLNLEVANPDGVADHTIINLDTFHANIAGSPVQASLHVQTPVSDPNMRALLKGKLDLSRISGLLPLDKNTRLAGNVQADIAAAGRYSAIQSERYQDFAAKGGILVRELVYTAGASDPALQLNSMQLDFAPEKLNMPECKGTYGRSDFNMTGDLRDFIGYTLGKSVLAGNLKFSSKLLDVNEFLATPVPEATSNADTMPLLAPVLPQNLNLGFALSVEALKYENLTLKDVRGNAQIKDGQLDLTGVQAGLLGGTIAMKGVYDSRNSSNPAANLAFTASEMSIPQSFTYFPMVRKYAPLAQYAKGLFSADISFKSIFSDLLKPNYQTMEVRGLVRISEAAVEQLEVIKNISAQLGIPVASRVDLKNQRFAFNINRGVFSLEDSLSAVLPGGIQMKVGGGSLLDETLQYGGRLLMPVKGLKPDNSILNAWQQEAAKKGIQVRTPEQLPVDFSIGGRFSNPIVKVALRTAANQAAADLKAQAKKQLEQQKMAAEARAKDSLDRIRQAGIQEAERLKAEAARKLEQEKQAAEARVQEEKRKAEEEAKRKLEAEKQKLKQQLKDKLKQGSGGGL
jgi:uncharacterized protein involved in outer membrane biogenesis